MGLLGWAIVALVISIIAGAAGFTGVAAGAATIARVLFGIFLVIAVVLFAMLLLGIDAVTQSTATANFRLPTSQVPITIPICTLLTASFGLAPLATFTLKVAGPEDVRSS